MLRAFLWARADPNRIYKDLWEQDKIDLYHVNIYIDHNPSKIVDSIIITTVRGNFKF